MVNFTLTTKLIGDAILWFGTLARQKAVANAPVGIVREGSKPNDPGDMLAFVRKSGEVNQMDDWRRPCGCITLTLSASQWIGFHWLPTIALTILSVALLLWPRKRTPPPESNPRISSET